MPERVANTHTNILMNRLLLITIPFLVWTTASSHNFGDHQYYTIEVRAGESVEEAEAGVVESVEEAGAEDEVDEVVDDIHEKTGGETSS